MRTTVTLDDALMREIKRAASKQQITVSMYLERAARTELDRQRRSTPPRRFRLVTFRGDGPQPGVDLARSGQVLEDLELAERG